MTEENKKQKCSFCGREKSPFENFMGSEINKDVHICLHCIANAWRMANPEPPTEKKVDS